MSIGFFEFLEPGQTVKIRDRNICDVTYFNDEAPLDVQMDAGSLWVAGEGEIVLNETTIIGEGFWAAGGFRSALSAGRGLAIQNYGISQNERIVAQFDPTAPGQLSYIDGCSNSNLVAPMRNGDPCLNYLHFPPGINQSFHTHPSVRIGYVTHGEGTAWFKVGGTEYQFPLIAGLAWIMDRHVFHRFSTSAEQGMTLVAYHPDSEDGPRDEANPMKTRTYLER